jgi:multidrug efflux pump subunit AcrA (membrane-fusion protein)
MNYRWLRTLATISLSLLAACRQPEAKKKQTPIVTVAVPTVEPVADYADFTGRTDAVSTVKIRARVSGYLVRVAFKDGDIVKEGALLYQIDPRPFQADLDQAKGVV